MFYSGAKIEHYSFPHMVNSGYLHDFDQLLTRTRLMCIAYVPCGKSCQSGSGKAG